MLEAKQVAEFGKPVKWQQRRALWLGHLRILDLETGLPHLAIAKVLWPKSSYDDKGAGRVRDTLNAAKKLRDNFTF